MKHKLSFFAILLMALALPQSVRAYDASYTAYFEEEVGIGDVAWEGIALNLQGSTLTIRGAEGEAATVTDLMGRTICSTVCAEPMHVELPASGVYFVRVGARPAKKVSCIR